MPSRANPLATPKIVATTAPALLPLSGGDAPGAEVGMTGGADVGGGAVGGDVGGGRLSGQKNDDFRLQRSAVST